MNSPSWFWTYLLFMRKSHFISPINMYEGSSQHEIPIKDSVRLIKKGIRHQSFEKRIIFYQAWEFIKLSVFILDKRITLLLLRDRRLKKGYILFKRLSITISEKTFSLFNWYFGILHAVFYLYLHHLWTVRNHSWKKFSNWSLRRQAKFGSFASFSHRSKNSSETHFSKYSPITLSWCLLGQW